MTTRRDFLMTTSAAVTWLALPGCARAASRGAVKRGAGKPLKILVLGGTGFLGPHFVEAARANGHKLTLFNRGKSNPTRFSGEEFKDIECAVAHGNGPDRPLTGIRVDLRGQASFRTTLFGCRDRRKNP